ncbi:MAG: enoyl-CoA hydratase/isomerase family protein [Acidimicrobiia bacterium]|nr:enoyl-CoA hydratase/isomerase family protein [Acidimicrobiia bacterium]
MGDLVRLDVDADKRVATVQLDRPPMNALGTDLVIELGEVTAELAASDEVRAVVLWGGPRIFAAGADIKEFPSLDRAGAVELSTRLNDTFLAFENLPQVTVAAVTGYALGGGCELAMAAEFRLAADTAVFGQPEILLGLIPGAGGTQRLTRLVGVTTAKELVYSGRQVTATEAVEIGLASAVHPADAVYDAAVELAATYAAGPAALGLAKRSIMGGLALPLDEAVKVETERFADCFDTDDARAGVQAFIDHGPGNATFTGT